jgi:4-hydroxy-3-methylbut-2-enyl diphosphate reductase
MKINLAKSSGFCFGVKRALQIAQQTAKLKKRIYLLGDIVHNEEVIRGIKKLGIKKINKLAKGKNNILLIRAHGASVKTLEKASKHGYTIIDATCPMVKEIHKIAREMERKKYKIIVIGDKKHDEVRGIIGQLKNKAIIVDMLEGIPWKIIKKTQKAAIVVQSTQNVDKVVEVVDMLRAYIKKLKFYDTICQPTKTKQKEIKTMSLKNDIMIIIGSKTSANTKRLYEISKSLNKKSYWIQSKKELRPKWFKGIEKVGVVAGASTPDFTTKSIIAQIHNYSLN